MIKIDGEKVRKLRESQGLTQLYMATAVEVTTDTISRWENKRYPTIKEENAQKLAETLGVSLEKILLDDEENAQPKDRVRILLAMTKNQGGPDKRKCRMLLSFIVSAFVVAGSIVAVAINLFTEQQDIADILYVKRVMPANTIPNSPFPVVIEVQYSGKDAVSIIVKESLPQGSEIIETSPVAGSARDNKEVKWIYKLKETCRFSYLVKIDGVPAGEYRFSGTVSTSRGKNSIAITGNTKVKLGKYHWADIDGNNTISDQEILTVFDDYYSGIDDVNVDIELIEEMWLGAGYSWDKEKNRISISP